MRHERTRPRRARTRWIVATALAGSLAAACAAGGCLRAASVAPARETVWGVTFSQKECAELGFDWRQAYSAVLSDLRPHGLRLVAYWDLVEPERGLYDFRDLDRQVAEAERVGIPVTIVIGQKVPRWPEYHFPSWLRVGDALERGSQLLRYEAEVVRRYRTRAGIRYWQVENEPFLGFGFGPKLDTTLLDREIALVRRLDPGHPVLLTDGGEYGGWVEAARRADVFGTTLYRRVNDPRLGTFTYPLAPGYYVIKQRLARLLTGRPREPFICSELGAEPWGSRPVPGMSFRLQAELFSPQDFAEAVAFARRTGFREFYLWGVEWWYYRRLHGDAAYWDEARAVMRGADSAGH